AELVVVDEACDRCVLIVLLAQAQGAERHPQGIEEQQAADERLSDAGEQLDRFGRLNRADHAGQYAEDASFRARRNEMRRRRLRVEASIAWAFQRREDGGLTIEAENRAVDVRFVEEHAGV